ncbi:MAG: exosortase/archaeosortase family protein [Pirellulales bacterium]
MSGAPTAEVSWNDPTQRVPLITLGLSTLALVVSYWDMFSLVKEEWANPLYSHGYIVPIFAIGLLWMRFQPFRPVPVIERWAGLGILVLGLSVRLFGVFMTMAPLDRYSFPVSLFGLFMLVGGWHMIRWAWPAILFLLFMFPLPSVLEHNILWRLQTLASVCSTFVLQTMGVAAFRQGNLISVPGADLNIADACSGLRMLTIFGALAVAMVFLVERPWWDKFMILLSAVPIALIVNIIRITCTGLLYMAVGPDNEFAKKLGHDWAGFFMMPLALGFLWIELQILERLTVPVEVAQYKPVGGRTATIPVR